MTLRNFSKTVFCVCLFPRAVLHGADDAAPAVRRTTIGVRIEYFPTNLFKTQSSQNSTTKPIADYSYAAYFGSSKVMLAPTVEYHLSDHFSLTGEIDWRRVHFQQVTDMRSGKRDPNSSYDDRVVSTITAATTASYWEFPILARYYGFRKSGWLGKTYVCGGVRFRHVASIATTTDYAWADGVQEHDTTPIKPNLGNQFGAVAGTGMRFIDESGIQLTPEVRYTRWQGVALQGMAYRSMGQQVEAGLGISF